MIDFSHNNKNKILEIYIRSLIKVDYYKKKNPNNDEQC